MENTCKKQWLCLENWVYAAIRPEQFMLYNTRNGQYIVSENKQHIALVAAMHERKNMGVVLLEKEWLDDAATWRFISEAVEKNIFTWEDYQEGALKPIRLMPVLNIQKDVERLKRESDRSVGETSLHYLTELTLYVNNSCSLDCSHCGQSHKQFMCCSRDKNSSTLDIELLAKIASQIKYASLSKLNIIGGDIFQYPELKQIPVIFSDRKEFIHYWFHYSNFQPDVIDAGSQFDILIDFPVDEQALSKCIAAGMKKAEQSHYHFTVQNEEEVNLVERMTNDLDIQDFEMHPYYNGDNVDFFKTCVFLNRGDIFSGTISQRRIFCNQALNSNFFGSLTVLPDGAVKASLNAPVLGNIAATPLLELIARELEQNTAWRKTRSEHPCNDCLFQYLCPPMSNYEMVFKRQNLCTLYGNV